MALAASLCLVRLIAELASPSGALSLAVAGEPPLLANVSLGFISGYVPAPCGAALEVRDAAGGAVLALVAAAAPPPANGSRASVFAVGAVGAAGGGGGGGGGGNGGAKATLAPDASDLLPEAAGNEDSAQWRVCNAIAGPGVVSIMGASAECHGCARPSIARAAYGVCSDYSRLDTTWAWRLGLADGEGLQASTTPLDVLALEHGSYTLVVHNAASWSPDATQLLAWSADVEGQDAYLPIAWAALGLLALGAAFRVLKAVAVRYVAVGGDAAAVVAAFEARSRGEVPDVTLMSFSGADADLARYLARERKKEGGGAGLAVAGSLNEVLLEAEGARGTGAAAGAAAAAAAAASSGNKPRSSGRIHSIDTFRGISLALMIFVNYGGGGYDAFFDHSRWNGLTVADLLFPWFTFLSGVSMAIAFASERRRGSTPVQQARRVLWRSAKLYMLGCFLNDGSAFNEWRVIGVLQYFAAASLVVGLLEAFLHPDSGAESAESPPSAALPATLADALRLEVVRYAWQWAVMGVLALVYLLVQFFLPLSGGCPTGYIGAGGLADGGAYLGLGCTGGAHRAVDLMLFGERHIYHDVDKGVPVSSATCSEVYRCDVYDPEGALGMLSAAWMAFLGLQAGRVFTTFAQLRFGPGGVKGTLRPFALRWLSWAALLCLLGGALCGFSKEDGLIPVNKNLWSPSFVLILAGFANANLAVLYAVVDVYEAWDGAPFLHAGMNSILVYAGSESFERVFPFTATITGDVSGHAEHLASNIAGVCAWLLVARWLYVKGMFVVL